MASPFQQQARTRKMIYCGLILALFTSALFYRRQLLQPQADRLLLREQNLGEADLTGAAVRLSLTGSRGVALSALWYLANDRQDKQEWNELELLVRSITKLQPHVASPWLFQSWNLSYNVAHECDDLRDKYFYISRGIQLLAEGVRQNRDHAELRFAVGQFYLHKFGQSDEAEALQALVQLSAIDPLERDPQRFRQASGAIDLKRFEEFCKRQPTLVRRLRERLGLRTPAAVVDYLADHRQLPSRFEPASVRQVPPPSESRLLPPEQQFPVLPRRADIPDLPVAAEDRLDAELDCFTVAQAWFQYANASPPLPPPSADPAKPLTHHDPTRHRLPRRGINLLIMRSYPARTQTFLAERRQRDGWFNDPWLLDEGKHGSSRWFAEAVLVGSSRSGSATAWRQAAKMWEEFGRANGLLTDPKGLDATQLAAQQRSLGITNLKHFLEQARVEAKPEAVAARQLFFEAAARRRAADSEAASRLYERGLTAWRQILLENPAYQEDLQAQIDAYLLQYRYLREVQDQHGSLVRQLLLAGDLVTRAAAPPAGAPLWLPPVNVIRPNLLPVGFAGPLDDVNRQGAALISAKAAKQAQARLGLIDALP